MVLRLKLKHGLLAEHLHGTVVLLAAGNDVLGGQVRQRQHEAANLLFQLALLRVHHGDLFLQLLQLVQKVARVQPLLFTHGNFLALFVALGLRVFVFENQLAATSIPRQQLGKVDVVLALFERFLHEIGIGTNQIQIKHVFTLQK